jgi:hypothetical protein
MGTNGEKRNTCILLVGKPEGRPRMDGSWRDGMGWYGLDCYGSG